MVEIITVMVLVHQLEKINNLHKPVCDFNDDDIKNTNLVVGEKTILTFESGIEVNGEIVNTVHDNGRILIVSFDDYGRVSFGDEILFQPEWGTFDMTCGSEIISVYGNRLRFDNYQEFLQMIYPKILK